MRRLIEAMLIALAIIVAGDIASGKDHIEGFGE
jgi:hypothetical protein